MDALKKLLNKKKTDAKFKVAGPGHKLSEASSPAKTGGSSSAGRNVQQQQPRAAAPSEERRQAALAALARVEKSNKGPRDPADILASRQLAFIKEQALKEIEAERKLKELELEKQGIKSNQNQVEEVSWGNAYEEGKETNPELYAVAGVYFSCPLIGPEVLPRHEIEKNILQFLLEQPEDELGMTACLMIHSCNRGRDKVQACVDTLCKYLDNIIQHPEETKYQKIRCSNKVFQEKVACMVGVPQFLRATGFVKTRIAPENGAEEEDYYVFESFENCTAVLTELRETLKATTPIRPELDRNLQVLMPAQVVSRKELPPEFYNLTPEELKREQKLRTELAERELTLRTKAQRERDEQRDQRLYRYAVMRIRFPDGLTLQGTFSASEKISKLYEYVRECLSPSLDKCDFSLRQAGGKTLSDLESTLLDFSLPPASIVIFKLESGFAPENGAYLNPEILALVQTSE